VAWERPDLFRKVVSHIGSFTNIRGGHVYPALIRKTENKPLRVFLQDGSGDLDNSHGNWWLSNLQMEKALQFKQYDHKTVWGEGGHNGKHGGAILPDTLRRSRCPPSPWAWFPGGRRARTSRPLKIRFCSMATMDSSSMCRRTPSGCRSI
jgi:hypothetical protein